MIIRPGRLVGGAVALAWVVSLVLASGPLAVDHETHLWGVEVSRVGSAVATWLAALLLTRRIGGPLPLVAGFAGVCAVALVLEPRGWVLSAGAVVAAVSYGLLGMVMTRASAGLLALREAVVVVATGAAGAVVVTGFDVPLRPSRFRMLVLVLTLVAALALARRLGIGLTSLGWRGLVLVIAAVALLLLVVGYAQAVRHSGSSGVGGSVGDAHNQLHDWLRDWLGASPRAVEALVGIPATIWGVAVRKRRQQGWWLSAFGSLAAAGIATSLAQPTVGLAEAAGATGYELLIGTGLGLVLIGVDRLLTGTGRRSRPPGGVDPQAPVPGRLAGLM